MKSKEAVALRILELCKEKKIAVNTLANLSGVSPSTVYSMLNEKSQNPDEFAALGTRVLAISRETRTINAYGYQRGDLYGMPEWCITLGMKQILSAKKVYIALNRPWQNGPLKHTILDAESAYVPASLLRRCPEVIFCGMEEVTKGIL